MRHIIVEAPDFLLEMRRIALDERAGARAEVIAELKASTEGAMKLTEPKGTRLYKAICDGWANYCGSVYRFVLETDVEKREVLRSVECYALKRHETSHELSYDAELRGYGEIIDLPDEIADRGFALAAELSYWDEVLGLYEQYGMENTVARHKAALKKEETTNELTKVKVEAMTAYYEEHGEMKRLSPIWAARKAVVEK